MYNINLIILNYLLIFFQILIWKNLRQKISLPTRELLFDTFKHRENFKPKLVVEK